MSYASIVSAITRPLRARRPASLEGRSMSDQLEREIALLDQHLPESGFR